MPANVTQTPSAVADALAPWTQTPIPPPPDKEMPQLEPGRDGGLDGGKYPVGRAQRPLRVECCRHLRASPGKYRERPRRLLPAPCRSRIRQLRRWRREIYARPIRLRPALWPFSRPHRRSCPHQVRRPRRRCRACSGRCPHVATNPPVSTPGVQTQRSIAPVPAPAVPASRPSAVNGSPQPAAPVMPAPPPESGASEDAPSWGPPRAEWLLRARRLDPAPHVRDPLPRPSEWAACLQRPRPRAVAAGLSVSRH